MSDHRPDLVSLIPAWVAATRQFQVPTPPTRDVLQRRAYELRDRLGAGNLRSIQFEPNDEGLAILSHLCFELASPDIEHSKANYRVSTAAFKFVSDLDWPSDLGEEQSQILCDLAVAAWNNARQILSANAAVTWQENYRSIFWRDTSPGEAADHFFTLTSSEFSDEAMAGLFCTSSELMAICEVLSDRMDTAPAHVAAKASQLYSFLMRHNLRHEEVLLYFTGEAALLAGGACRYLGRQDRASSWLERAEESFVKTFNARPALLRLAHARLLLGFEAGQYCEILEHLPSLFTAFEDLGMQRELSKARLLEASCLKALGRSSSALRKFIVVRDTLLPCDHGRLLGYVFGNIGELLALEGQHEEAMRSFRQALMCLAKANRPNFLAYVKGAMAQTLRDRGQLGIAIELYRESVNDYAALGYARYVAYTRILLAEVLLLANRVMEAELEILAALPTIETGNLVREGMAAVALLRRSVRESRTSLDVLQRVREYMKGSER